MHGHTDEWVANRVKWKVSDFLRQPSELLFFDSADNDEANRLRRVAEQRSAGLPIMAIWRSDEFMDSDSEWDNQQEGFGNRLNRLTSIGVLFAIPTNRRSFEAQHGRILTRH